MSDPELLINQPMPIEKIAALYAQVFAGEPWNEFTQSPGCGKYFGLMTKPGDPCPNCRDLLQSAYPTDSTSQTIQSEIGKSNSVLALLQMEKELIGFAWGYSYESASEFLREGKKYKTPEMQRILLNLFAQIKVEEGFYYFSETGIDPKWRGKNLSNNLAQVIVSKGYELNQPVIMRTNWQSPMVAVAKKVGMLQVFGPEVAIENKNIMRTGRIINGMDLENQDRILYVSYPPTWK